MPSTLHFLNGDATKLIFDQTAIEGDTAVIRETFCSGPLHPSFDEKFWNARQQWFQQNYFVSAARYNEKVKEEFLKAERGYNEIVIWYEYDVYCQINMLGYLNWLTSNTKSKISLVYSPKGLGRLAPEDYPHLFNKRNEVSATLKENCQSIWRAITQKDSTALTRCSAQHLGLPNMSNALRCYHHQNFGYPYMRPLQLRVRSIIQSGTTNGKQIIRRLLELDNIFGYGDYQYLLLLISMNNELEFEQINASSMDDLVSAVHNCTFSIKKGS